VESLYGERAGEIAVELAMHFEQGASYEQAVKYLQQAADNDIRRFAYQEAVVLSRRGLELLGRLPDNPQHARQQLRLQLTLGVSLIVTEGYSAAGVGSAYVSARELCQQLGEAPEISQALWGLWTFHILRGDLETSRELAEEFLRMSERLSYPGFAMRAHLVMEVTCMHLGEFAAAIEHFEKTLSLYDPARRHDDFLYTQDPEVGMRCFAAWSLWFLGKPDQAKDRAQEALDLALQLRDPHGMAHALFFASILHQFRREAPKAQEYAESAIAVCSEHRLVMYGAQATIIRAWALIEQGRQEEGIEQMRQGFAAYHATDTRLERPHFATLLAEALGKEGKAEEGLRGLKESAESALLNGDALYLAELYRIQGELLLVQSTSRALSRPAPAGRDALEASPPGIAQAEACFHQSIKIARKQKAKSWELRAVMSLARLYQNQDKEEQARNLLVEIYSGFTEGFDTADLRDAKALLNQLS